MAWTISINEKTVFGNKRVHVLSCTADAATQNVDTGLEAVDFFVTGPISCTAGTNQAIYKNVGATATSLAGYLGCSGFTSGDVFYVTVFGR